MTVEAEDKTKSEEEANAEVESVATIIVKGKKADAEDEDAPNSQENIATLMVAAHTSVMYARPKEVVTKTPPPLKICREAEP